MAVDAISASTRGAGEGGAILCLGIDQPAGWWPTAPRLKSYEAAGFDCVQVRMPPREVLQDRRLVEVHAHALRTAVELTGLRLILHAPDDLLAGASDHDRQLVGALQYAALAGSDLVVYHGARVDATRSDLDERLAAEERSLRRVLRRAAALGVHLAIENLAPVYPGIRYASEDPRALSRLVKRLASEHAGICLDIGHAHVAAELAGCEIAELIEPVLSDIVLFHVHDNFGARGEGPRIGGIEPLRLDLHLAPGAGSIRWETLVPLLSGHPAPLQLEVHPSGRPEPATLAIVTRELVAARQGRARTGGPARTCP